MPDRPIPAETRLSGREKLIALKTRPDITSKFEHMYETVEVLTAAVDPKTHRSGATNGSLTFLEELRG